MLNKFFIFIYDNGIYDQEVYKYYLNNAFIFDYYEQNMFKSSIGCSLIIDKDTDILLGIKPIVPAMVDDITTLINIIEYVHTLCLYNKINKKYKDSVTSEVLPMYYENLFVMENESKELQKFKADLDKAALNSNDEKDLIALKLSYKLLDERKNNDNFKKVNKKVKKLSKRNYY